MLFSCPSAWKNVVTAFNVFEPCFRMLVLILVSDLFFVLLLFFALFFRKVKNLNSCLCHFSLYDRQG